MNTTNLTLGIISIFTGIACLSAGWYKLGIINLLAGILNIFISIN